VAWGEKHADVLDRETLLKLRTTAKQAHDFGAAQAWLERLVSQQGGDQATLAWMLFDRAELELSSLQVEPALARLQRAHELKPGFWLIAERLASLRLQRNELRQAARVLNAFIEVATEPVEKDKARQILARIPPI